MYPLIMQEGSTESSSSPHLRNPAQNLTAPDLPQVPEEQSTDCLYKPKLMPPMRLQWLCGKRGKFIHRDPPGWTVRQPTWVSAIKKISKHLYEFGWRCDRHKLSTLICTDKHRQVRKCISYMWKRAQMTSFRAKGVVTEGSMVSGTVFANLMVCHVSLPHVNSTASAQTLK